MSKDADIRSKCVRHCYTLAFFSIAMYFLVNLSEVNSIAVPHIHHNKDKLNKETEVHGAYSPRDQNHYKDGEHRSEFDHEAILGK